MRLIVCSPWRNIAGPIVLGAWVKELDEEWPGHLLSGVNHLLFRVLYNHVAPPVVDENGYGLRVPRIVISPYARRGYIDHQTLSFDAYVKFIEDDFLGGQRLDPKTDGRPDPRPTVRENASALGDISQTFDFSQPPRSPLLLDPHPSPGPASTP